MFFKKLISTVDLLLLFKPLKMQNQLFKRPSSYCYVIKKPFSQTMYSIDREGKRTVVAFKKKEQAHVLKRLIFDLEIKDPKKKKTVVIEKMEVSFLTRTCCVSSLDFILYNHDNSFLVYTACDDVNDDMRFEFENRFRYGG